MEVSDIIEAIDIEEYLSQYCDFEERGGELWALSPFKDENTPSFSVCVEKGYWYDFSAGFGGNLIDFVMKKDGVGLRDAVNILKKYANIKDDGSTVPSRLEASRVARKYRSNTKPLPKCTAKIRPENYMNRYEFRREKLQLWADEGIRWDVMQEFGVRYDAFDNRIVYPIRDYSGNIISVCGRTCDPDFKQKGIRKYTYFQSIGTVDTLYGFSENREHILSSGEIILFEGAKSCLMAAGWGIRNTSAILTSHLSVPQFRFLLSLSSFHSVRIVFALDSDVDIEQDENIRRLLGYARVEWLRNADGLLAPKDSPVDKGEEVFRKLYGLRRAMN